MSKIMIIEDDPAIVIGLKEALTQVGYEILAYSDGEEGYQAAKEEEADLILLDIMLPNRNGLEILKTMADRLISIHLHDNDGISDQHKLMFSGTINWDRLAGILAASSYSGCISLEVNMRNHQGMKQKLFLSKAYEDGVKLTNMVKKHFKNL